MLVASLTVRFGAHISAAGGLTGAVAAAQAAGCDAFQVFVSNPRGWRPPAPDPEGEARFREAVAGAGLGPVLVHACYLVNFASVSEQVYERSLAVTAATLAKAAAIGAAGVVVHTGHAMGGGRARALARTREAVLRLLDGADGPQLLMEPTAGQGEPVASCPADLAELLDACERHPRLGVCWDTCHAHAAGCDLATAPGATAAVDELLAAVGDRLGAVHANDSATPCGSRRDRHAHIGTGTIGDEGFAALLRHPGLAGLPVIVETPPPGHAADVARLRQLAGQEG